MSKKVNITISGKVQQVGFRWFVSYHAKKLGLNGFVMNNSDGSVYIEVEGIELILIEFISEIKKGPRLAKIDKVIEAFEPAKNMFTNFLIK